MIREHTKNQEMEGYIYKCYERPKKARNETVSLNTCTNEITKPETKHRNAMIQSIGTTSGSETSGSRKRVASVQN